jgi:hemolysin activation/secretion protein
MLCVFLDKSVNAQEILGVEPKGGIREERPELPEELKPGPKPEEILPPLEIPPEKEEKRFPAVTVFAHDIRIIWSTIFTAEELDEFISPYVNRKITSEDLEELRLAITRSYINKGYVNSGAVIPDQTVVEGVITIQVIEGELTRVEVEGNRWFVPGYIEKRLSRDAGPPLNISLLQQQLLLLHQDERIDRINAELRPGIKRGESVLNVHVAEHAPLKLWLDFNNYESPTIGAERGQGTIAHRNLTGHGDILSFTFGRSSGIDAQVDTSYTLPLTARDTSLTLRYRRNDYNVIEEPFEPLDIETESNIFEITIRHPLYKTLNNEFALALTGEHLHNKTFLLGEPFSFSPGTENGKSKVSALRFSQEWTYRSQTEVIAVNSRFSLGVDAFDATINADDSIPDGEFFSWMFNFQWARRLGALGIQTIARMDLQLSADPLLSLEQISVGGRYSVRGYRENQLVRDNAFIASLEARVPLVHEKPWADYIHLVPFVDYGNGWNTTVPTPSLKSISSVGLGLRWALTFHSAPFRPEFEIYWGVPLRDVKTVGGDLQDDGIHFRVAMATF